MTPEPRKPTAGPSNDPSPGVPLAEESSAPSFHLSRCLDSLFVCQLQGNFSVASERTIEGLTAASVERDFRDILQWTPQGGGNSRR